MVRIAARFFTRFRPMRFILRPAQQIARRVSWLLNCIRDLSEIRIEVLPHSRRRKMASKFRRMTGVAVALSLTIVLSIKAQDKGL